MWEAGGDREHLARDTKRTFRKQAGDPGVIGVGCSVNRACFIFRISRVDFFDLKDTEKGSTIRGDQCSVVAFGEAFDDWGIDAQGSAMEISE